MSFVARMFTPSKSDNQSGTQYNDAYNKASQPGQNLVVDPNSQGMINNLGRAALISTSPQGVQGTDATARYRLLGNSTALGN